MATRKPEPYRIPLSPQETQSLLVLAYLVNRRLFGAPGSPALGRIFTEAHRVYGRSDQ